MAEPAESENRQRARAAAAADRRVAIYPVAFSIQHRTAGSDIYLGDPAAAKLAEFFEAKGLAAIKDEDRREQWYEDWLAFQAEHRLYAAMLSPKQFSSLNSELDLLKLTRFLEVFAYFSPAHGYSFQVTFLGLFSILMGTNSALKQEAIAALEAGGLLAFGVSEKDHGSDLLANEFTLRKTGAELFVANGRKYYIGNANAAAIVSILARMEDERTAGRGRRSLPILFALRPAQAKGFGNVRKIQTLGIRAAFVGEFEVRQHQLPQSDVIAEGRHAWDAVLGTVTLGKFFLGFGSIGICEHAFAETMAHLSQRVLFGKPVVDMPHIASAVAQAWARMTAMKLYAYRTLDYVHSCSADDRRYLLFAAVQKALVSTEGVKVMALLSGCLGAKAFESNTYFEMALRDVQLIPPLEGSTHVNLALIAQFVEEYFTRSDRELPEPESLFAGPAAPGENPYLMEARAGAVNTVEFGHFLNAYRPLMSVPNVRVFARQAKAFSLLVRHCRRGGGMDAAISLAVGHCLATIAYAQLIAENCSRLDMPIQIVATIFHLLVNDMSTSALALASSGHLDLAGRKLIRRMIEIPQTPGADWDFALHQAIAKTKRSFF
jgi:acyl-CoA dehydrogenase